MVPLSPPILQSPMGPQKVNDKPVKLNGKPIEALQEKGYSIVETITMSELAMYQHQTLYLPPKSTLLRAIANQQLKSFPGLTFELINKHLSPSSASGKCNMIQTRKNLQLTRSQRKEILDARLAVGNMNPPHEICTAINNEIFCFAALADAIKDTIYSDLAG